MNLPRITLRNSVLIIIILVNLICGNAYSNTLSGDIKLPNSATATHEIGITVGLLLYDSSGNVVPDDTGFSQYEKYDFVSIEEGENSASYLLDFSDAPEGSGYEISAYCTNCDFYLSRKIYLQDDGSTGLTYNTIDHDFVPSVADFKLIEKKELSGSIRLPNGDMATEDINVFLNLSSYDKNGSSLSSRAKRVTIESGANSVSFSLLYQSAPVDGSYRFEVNCSSSCYGKYVNVNMVLQEDGGFAFGLFERTTVSDLPQNIDVELIPVNKVTGIVSLPNKQLADIDTDVGLIVETYDDVGEFIAGDLTDINIKQGESSAPYELTYPPSPDSWSHLLKAHVIGANEIYSSQYLYLQKDGSSGPGFTRVSGTQIPSAADFELLELREIGGVVQLSTVAVIDMRISVSVWAFDKNSNFVANKDEEITIESGSDLSPFRLRYGPAPSNGFYTVSIVCLDNCTDFLSETIYLKSANQCRFDRTLIRAASMPGEANFDLSVCFTDSDFVMPPIMLLLDE